MKMLRKTIKAIVVIALLKVIMLVLDRYSPSSSVFHRQLLFSAQLLVIVWLLLTLLLFVFKAGKSWVARFLPVLIIMVVLAFDILYTSWLERPANAPRFLKEQLKYYYAYYERNVIEFEPCSIYDSAYSYKLIPRLTFAFGNNEYKNNYVTNSESLRDDENGLSGADIVCAGNAYTLGVGVEQNETYPALLEQATGMNVLNTGYPAFGTAREMKRVVNTDTSILKYLLIQYSKYDVYENDAYLTRGDAGIVRADSNQFKDAVREYRWRKEYFPGKYAITITYDFLKSKANKLRKKKYFMSEDQAASAERFLKVIDKYAINEGVKILVTEVNDINDMDSGFLRAVDSLIQQGQFPRLKDRLQTVDVSKVLTENDYYIIDSHLKPSGHQKIATVLAQYIK